MSRALGNRWNLKPEVRQEVVGVLLAVVRDPDATRYQRVTAARALMMADAIDVRRERTEVIERGQDTATGIASLRALMDTPAGRAALDQLIDQLPGPGPDPIPPASQLGDTKSPPS
jgi:hypothetical protein